MDERIKQIEMVVSDLDDTLVRSDKRISDDTKRVFGECVKRGIRTAFATASCSRIEGFSPSPRTAVSTVWK